MRSSVLEIASGVLAAPIAKRYSHSIDFRPEKAFLLTVYCDQTDREEIVRRRQLVGEIELSCGAQQRVPGVDVRVATESNEKDLDCIRPATGVDEIYQ